MSGYDPDTVLCVSFVERSIRMCQSADFVALMRQSLNELLENAGQPENHRVAMGQNLTAKISAIQFASFAANRNPSVASNILDCTRQFCERYSLTSDVHVGSQELTTQVSDLQFQAMALGRRQ
ncbi:MAG: hypothetical protein KF777_00985 [Planctomycetaceae bacterium]|nr:hypothetical protein [Planctomycetaceae bacterium]